MGNKKILKKVAKVSAVTLALLGSTNNFFSQN